VQVMQSWKQRAALSGASACPEVVSRTSSELHHIMCSRSRVLQRKEALC
jgi:hypothetical protein